jgi:hypothetical protein
MKILFNRKLFELFELFNKKVRNYWLFDKFLNSYLNPSLVCTLSRGLARGGLACWGSQAPAYYNNDIFLKL